jgi:ankyrin repeat protein
MKSFKGLLLIFSLSLLAVTGIKANSDTNTIKDNIFTAIRSIDYTSINILLSEGTDIDTVDQQGNTPLMVATEIGNPRIMDIILSHNPTIDKQNKEGMTALMIAAKTGQLHAVKKLLSHGADYAARNNSGNNPITLASKFGHTEIVTFFKESRIPRSYTK